MLIALSASLMAQTARISKIVGISPNPDGLAADSAVQQFTYSADGKISKVETRVVEHDSDGDNIISTTISFSYSANLITGKAVSIESEGNGLPHTSTESITYTLDNGLIIQETVSGTGEDGTYSYTYDNDNRLKKITYHSDGEDDETTTVTWTNGNITGMNQSSNGIDLQHYIYTYSDTIGNEQIRAIESPLSDLIDYEELSPLYMTAMGFYGKVNGNLLRTGEIRSVDGNTEYPGEVYDYSYKFNESGDRIRQVTANDMTSEITWTDETTGLEHVTTFRGDRTGIFSLGGAKLSRTQHGVNIITTKDGKTKKVFVR